MLWSLEEDATTELSQLTARSDTSVSCPRHAISSIPVCSLQICRPGFPFTARLYCQQVWAERTAEPPGPG